MEQAGLRKSSQGQRMNTFPDEKLSMGSDVLPATRQKLQGTATVTEDELQDFAQEIKTLATPVPISTAGSQGGDRLPHGERFPTAALPVSQPGVPIPAALKNMLGVMEGFLACHAGLDGLPLALVFEQITSIAQLRRELPAYFELIRSYGADARIHEKQLAEMFTETETEG